MLRVKERKLLYSFDFEKDFITTYGENGWTKENIKDFLFINNYNKYRRGHYYVVQEDHNYVESTLAHRLNHLWAWPLTLILAPFMYVVKGEMGWSESSKIGHWILKVCGYIKK